LRWLTEDGGPERGPRKNKVGKCRTDYGEPIFEGGRKCRNTTDENV